MLKLTRAVCLLLMLGMLAARPTLLFGAESEGAECCRDFEVFCQGYCVDKGGVLITSCYGWQCAENCYCNDIDPATQNHYHYSTGGPHYCDPCPE
jgi:hypothetical protein